jgi:hypothetical protein
VSRRALVISALACTGLVLLTAWFFEMPLEKAVLAAPLIVLTAGAAAGLVLIWTKVVVEGVRGRRR